MAIGSLIRDNVTYSHLMLSLYVCACICMRRGMSVKSESSPARRGATSGFRHDRARSNPDTVPRELGGHRSRECFAWRRFSLPRNGLASR